MISFLSVVLYFLLPLQYAIDFIECPSPLVVCTSKIDTQVGIALYLFNSDVRRNQFITNKISMLARKTLFELCCVVD